MWQIIHTYDVLTLTEAKVQTELEFTISRLCHKHFNHRGILISVILKCFYDVYMYT